MVGRRLPLLLTASGLTWLAFDAERDAIVSMLASAVQKLSISWPADRNGWRRSPAPPERLWRKLPRLAAGGENRLDRRAGLQSAAGCGCLNWSIASAMTIEQAAQNISLHCRGVARQIEARMEEEEVWYEMP